jgi:cytochrome c553
MRKVRSSGRMGAGAMLWLAFALVAPRPAWCDSRVLELIHRSLTTMPEERHGAQLYAAHCAQCHAAKAQGASAKAIPALAAQHVNYLVEQLAAFVEFERDDSGAHRFLAGGELSQPQALADVAAYLAALPAAPPARGRGKVDPNSLSKGAELYAASCTACHGVDASGDGEHFIPALNGQNQPYLLLQLRRLTHGHRRDMREGLMEELDHMSSAQLEAVALYLSRLPAVRAQED